jgi:hypothetical protein
MEYAKKTEKSEREQLDVVAQFHAHRIAPVRIAYRTGIELDFVKALLAGELHPQLFNARVEWHRKARRAQRLKASLRKKGTAQLELQQRIEADA